MRANKSPEILNTSSHGTPSYIAEWLKSIPLTVFAAWAYGVTQWAESGGLLPIHILLLWKCIGGFGQTMAVYPFSITSLSVLLDKVYIYINKKSNPYYVRDYGIKSTFLGNCVHRMDLISRICHGNYETECVGKAHFYEDIRAHRIYSTTQHPTPAKWFSKLL